MGTDFWPLRRLRLTADTLELRLPNESEVDELARLASTESYNPSVPFLAGIDDTPVERGRRTLQTLWKDQAAWAPDRWVLYLVALDDGEPAGVANIRANDFAAVREVETGSWLHTGRRGTGLGTRLRVAALTLAFDGLGAEYAASSASIANNASLGVSAKLGYHPDGIDHRASNGEVLTIQRLRLAAADWAERKADWGAVTVTGLAECRAMFGLDTAGTDIAAH
ncbi:MAG TPA: GNAT family protein [Pseudonocardiaceae bacterium]|jgi:RimJ/RimL family protein N-acetyltransferase|nr:GNAT family protein [Pseudonocardiaceae bacterium]